MKIRLRDIAVLLLSLYLVVLPSCSKDEGYYYTDRRKNIVLIMKMKNGDYWSTVRMGAETAAKEFNIDLQYNAPEDENINNQINLVNRALENKADALILAPSDFKALATVTEKVYNQKIPVIIIDSEVDTKKVHCFIATDNFKLGREAGLQLIQTAGDNCNIAVMSFIKGSGNAEKREKAY